MNTGSSKKILQLIGKLLELNEFNSEVEINWYYEDEDIYDLGSDFKNMLKTEINLIKNF